MEFWNALAAMGGFVGALGSAVVTVFSAFDHDWWGTAISAVAFCGASALFLSTVL
jgi:hypothetical protein